MTYNRCAFRATCRGPFPIAVFVSFAVLLPGCGHCGLAFFFHDEPPPPRLPFFFINNPAPPELPPLPLPPPLPIPRPRPPPPLQPGEPGGPPALGAGACGGVAGARGRTRGDGGHDRRPREGQARAPSAGPP